MTTYGMPKTTYGLIDDSLLVQNGNLWCNAQERRAVGADRPSLSPLGNVQLQSVLFLAGILRGGIRQFVVHLESRDQNQSIRIPLQNNSPPFMNRFFPSTALLIVAEFAIPEGAALDYGKWADLQMLIFVGGRERTETKSVICRRPQDSNCRKWLLQVSR